MQQRPMMQFDSRILYVLFLSYPVFQAVGGFKGNMTITSLLFILSFVYYYFKNSHFKKVVFSFPTIVWFILTIYHWINGMTKDVPEVGFLDLLHGLKIYSAIVLVTYWASIDFSKTVKTLVKCFSVYLIIAYLICDFDEDNGRLSGALYSTQVGQMGAITGVFIGYYGLIFNTKLRKLVLMYLLPISLIFLTQSRNSLGMMALAILGYIIGYIFENKKEMTNRLSSLLLNTFILGCFSLSFILNSSIVGRIVGGQDFKNQSHFYQQNATGTLLDDIVGDRLVYYILGWNYFENSPLTGIGMWNFKYVSGRNFPLHTEYMVHLCEGGLIGFMLWVTFVLFALWTIFKYKENKGIKYIAFASIAVLLFGAIYAREFYYEFFYPVYGLALSLAYYNRQRSIRAK